MEFVFPPLRGKRDAPARRRAHGARAKDAQATKKPRAAGRRPQWPSGFVALLALVLVLDIVGLVMVLSASSVHDLRVYHSAWYSFGRQSIYVTAGTVAMFVTMRIDYHRWRRYGAILLMGCMFLLLLVLVPGIGVRVSGSARWLGAGPLQFQPSELLKPALAIFCADILCRRARYLGEGFYALMPVLAAFGMCGVLVMAQPDMGTTLVLSCIVFAVLFVGGVRLTQMAGMLVTGAFGAFVLGIVEPYRRARMMSFLHPLADKSNTGYQSVQGLVALGSGGLFGTGLGASRAKWGFLPNAHTDFIFAIIGDELGLIGTVLVVGLFVAFAVLGIRAAVRAQDRFGALLAAGITSWIVGQAVLNIGAVIGLLPVTGVPMPFVSYGGTSLVICMAAVGMLLNIARSGRQDTRTQRKRSTRPAGAAERTRQPIPAEPAS
jgi:cell division protein FtsW